MRPKAQSLAKIGTLLSLLLVGALFLAGQGLTTDASPRDWEEVNFEFNSHILSDGYPSLLRLADLLKQNPGYRLELTGHTDSVGSTQYNESLSMRRSNTVKEFLVKYGATPAQITTTGLSKNAPKVPNTSKEGRFINRRVVMTLRDANGNVVAAGGVGGFHLRPAGTAQKAGRVLQRDPEAAGQTGRHPERPERPEERKRQAAHRTGPA